MKRRGFLGLLAAAPVGAIAAKIDVPEVVERYCYEAPLLPTFSLREELLPIPYHPPSPLILEIMEVLREALDVMFSQAYGTPEARAEWAAIFNDQPVETDEVVLYGFGHEA